MTPLVLTERDQQRLAAVTQALLSPLVYPDAEAWRRDTCNQVRSLLGADKLMFVLPHDGRADVFTEDFDPDIKEYPDWIESVQHTVGYFERLAILGAATRRMLFGDLRAYYRTTYWNEYGKPRRAYDSLTMSVQVGPKKKLAHHSQLIANHDSPHKTPFGDKEVAVGRLLLPALQTGAITWLRLSQTRHAFSAMVDALTTGTLVYDADGNELHRNPVALRLMESNPVARGLVTLAGQMARALGRPVPKGMHFGNVIPPTAVRAGDFTLRATRLCADVAGREGIVLVTLEGPASPEPSVIDPMSDEVATKLQERAGLTRQQARVALLLAARRTTAEIAETLFISPNTVRRHAEQVLERLEVRRREEVEAAVRRTLSSAQ